MGAWVRRGMGVKEHVCPELHSSAPPPAHPAVGQSAHEMHGSMAHGSMGA